MYNNETIINNAFTKDELDKFKYQGGVFYDMNGPLNRVLIKPMIDTIKSKIDFESVKTILDIGSRDGCQSLELNRYFPNATIYAFEPTPSSYNYTKENTKNIFNIKVLPYAVSSYNGKTKFYEVYNGNVGASSLLEISSHPRASGWRQREIEVECIHLENWLIENNISNVDIAWVDVQGAEKIVFESFGRYLNSVKVIATEVGNVPLYKGAIVKPELDSILSEFECVSSTLVGNNTEVDVVYLNKNL
jgi:FkbM family methyltransferase